MRVNSSQTHELVIDFRNQKIQEVPNIIMNDSGIQLIDNAKVLGVTISSDLTWNVHVENITVKASKRIYMLYQLKRAGIDQNDLLRIYLCMISPVVEYACPVWSTNPHTYLSDNIEMVQKRALKIIYPGVSYTEILHSVKIPTLLTRRSANNILMTWKSLHTSWTIFCLLSGTCHTHCDHAINTHESVQGLRGIVNISSHGASAIAKMIPDVCVYFMTYSWLHCLPSFCL